MHEKQAGYIKPSLRRFGTMREITKQTILPPGHCDPVCGGHDHLPVCSSR